MSVAAVNSDDRRAVEHDCGQTLARFFKRLDAADYPGTWALLAPDAVWNRGGVDIDTHEKFLAAMATRPTELLIRHLMSNVVVDVVDATHADAEFTISVFRHIGARAAGPAPMHLPAAIAAFVARLVPVDDQWRISYLSADPLFKDEAQ